MKIIRYHQDGRAAYGVLEEDGTIRELAGSPFAEFEVRGAVARLDEVQMLAPVTPSKCIGVGLNYAPAAACCQERPWLTRSIRAGLECREHVRHGRRTRATGGLSVMVSREQVRASAAALALTRQRYGAAAIRAL